MEPEIADLNRGGNPEVRLSLPQNFGQFPVLAMHVADDEDTHTLRQSGRSLFAGGPGRR